MYGHIQNLLSGCGCYLYPSKEANNCHPLHFGMHEQCILYAVFMCTIQQIPWSAHVQDTSACQINFCVCQQECALEVFNNDGRSHFLIFEISMKNKVYNKSVSYSYYNNHHAHTQARAHTERYIIANTLLYCWKY